MKVLFWIFLVFFTHPLSGFSRKAEIVNLKCEYFNQPLAINTAHPRLSWNIETAQKNWMQGAYHVLVSSDSLLLAKNQGDLWNSGRVESEQCLNIEYQGEPLNSRQDCWWKVQVWDKEEESIGWSQVQKWRMGILEPTEWKGEWISSDLQLKDYQQFLKGFTDFGMEPESEIWEWAPKIRKMIDTVETAPAVYLRKTFDVSKPVENAVVSLCGLGLQKLSINGRKTRDYLHPVFSDYQKRVYYSTYDVTQDIREGENAIGVILGNGWFNLIIPHVLRYYAADYIAPPRLLFELIINYQDGTQETITSDETWKFTTSGPIRFNCLLGGETYDARLEMEGWDSTGFDDSSWESVLFASPPEGRLISENVYPVSKDTTYHARNVSFKGDTVIVDFGYELTGWCRMKLKGEKGRMITIRYPGAPSHTLGRYQTHKYIFKGDGEEVYEPKFSYNGFRTVEITGLDYRPDVDDFIAQAVYTALPSVGSFECSNEKLNRLQSILLHTIRNYIVHIPNDPTREKSAWTQDVETGFEELAYNYDCNAMYAKWQNDFLDIQHENGYVPPVTPGRFDGYTINGPWWGGMIVYLPWRMYQFFNDKRILEESYPAMKKQVDFLTSISDSSIVSWGLGDWMEPGSARPVKTPVSLTSTIAYFHYADIVSRTAGLLGLPAEKKKYADLASAVKSAYNWNFLNMETGEYGMGSQTAQILSLCLGLVPTEKEQLVREALLRRIQQDSLHLSTGFVGTPFLLNGLNDLGYPEIAYKIATQDSYPGWFDMVFNHGNTVLKEAWDGGLVQMPSLGGPIGRWFYASLAGIKNSPEFPGFKKIIINPATDVELSYAKSSLQSVYGLIISNWKKEKNKIFMRVKIPPNTQAVVYLPSKDRKKIREGGKQISRNSHFHKIYNEKEKTVVEVGSGEYFFTIEEDHLLPMKIININR